MLRRVFHPVRGAPHYYVDISFSSSSVVSRAFSVVCVYSTFGHHPHPLATVVPNFVSFAASVAELARGEKRLLTHSPSLFDAPVTEAFASEPTTAVS